MFTLYETSARELRVWFRLSSASARKPRPAATEVRCPAVTYLGVNRARKSDSRTSPSTSKYFNFVTDAREKNECYGWISCNMYVAIVGVVCMLDIHYPGRINVFPPVFSYNHVSVLQVSQGSATVQKVDWGNPPFRNILEATEARPRMFQALRAAALWQNFALLSSTTKGRSPYSLGE